MKAVLISLAAICLLAVPASGERHKYSDRHCVTIDSHSSVDGMSLNIRDGELIFTPTDEDIDEEVRITEKHELFVNDHRVKLDAEQQELVDQYYVQMEELIDSAKKIGLEGAKVGVEGAALGVKAVASVFKLLSPDYDTEDLEREMEKAAAKIEAKAAKLEDKAEEIEDQADELEDLHDDLCDEIPELDKLDWFR